MTWTQKFKNDYWSDAKKDNFKDGTNHNITLVLGWFLRVIISGFKAMLLALVDIVKLFFHF